MCKGPRDITLQDDGTLDTVVSFTCPDCGRSVEWRYSQEMRPVDEHGDLDWETMKELVCDDWHASDGGECDCMDTRYTSIGVHV